MTRALAWSTALYRRLLHVYDPELRREFGLEITSVFEDDLRDACRERGLRGFLSVWRCAAVEILQAALRKTCGAPGFLVPLISSIASACCLGGELAIARAHAPAPHAALLPEAVWALIVFPSLTAAAVSFAAVRSTRPPQIFRLTAEPHRPSSVWERL